MTRTKLYENAAQKQAAYRARLAEDGICNLTVQVSVENMKRLNDFLESKNFGTGQFSKYQGETMSSAVNRALQQFLRKR